jgi:hypothetical protein
VHDEIAGLDPPADRTCRDVETFCHLGDGEESDLIAAVMATTDMGESSRFHNAVAGALTSRHSMGFLYSGTVLHPTLAARAAASRSGWLRDHRWHRCIGWVGAAGETVRESDRDEVARRAGVPISSQ